MTPWIAIGIYLVSPGTATSPPGFVYGTFVSLFVFFNCFALIQWLQYRQIGKWRDYLYGESLACIAAFGAARDGQSSRRDSQRPSNRGKGNASITLRGRKRRHRCRGAGRHLTFGHVIESREPDGADHPDDKREDRPPHALHQ